MVGVEKADWNLALGNLFVFAVACVITLAVDASNAVVLMG